MLVWDCHACEIILETSWVNKLYYGYEYCQRVMMMVIIVLTLGIVFSRVPEAKLLLHLHHQRWLKFLSCSMLKHKHNFENWVLSSPKSLRYRRITKTRPHMLRNVSHCAIKI